MRPAEVFHRHDWVYLHDNWRHGLMAPLPAEDRDALACWTGKRRPLVVARRREGDGPDLVRLGLALPGKRRVCVAVAAGVLGLRRAPPYVLDIVEIGAEFWPGAMRDLAQIFSRAAPDARVFGSLAWQFFAADPACRYATAQSDIDLLLRPSHAAQWAAWLALLNNFESRWHAPRLDGEIALPGGEFVSWREFSARPKKLLVKGGDRVSLRPIEEIDALLSARAA